MQPIPRSIPPPPEPPPPQLSLSPGDIIASKYRVDSILGTGGMGVVWSATHLELDAPVAIKVVREDLASNEQVVSRLLFEARAAARMRGTHIVRVLDVARLDTGAPYIVMEQLRGSDLAVLLAERGALSVPEAVRYILQACEGLAEAHELGIIHRDLKPENLFLANTPEGVVIKILDFGISKEVGSSRRAGSPSTLTKQGLAVGSPYYMSPEQMRASADLDGRADIWSLGAILFEFVSGRCPFEADTTALLCSKIMLEPAPSLRSFLSAAPEPLDAIVQRCLQKDASARFQTVRELADALRAFCLAEELGAAPSRRLSSGIDFRTDSAVHTLAASAAITDDEENPFARRRTGLALFGVCTLLMVAGVAFWELVIRSDDARPPTASQSAPALARPARVTQADDEAVEHGAPSRLREAAASAPAPSAAVKPAARANRAPGYWPPSAAARGPAPDSPEARYGL